MAMLKVIEVLAQSPENWETAAQSAITAANKTVKNIRSIYIENLEASVENGKITNYRVNAKVTFELE